MITELEIIDLKVGEGKEAVKGALITTHYTGWLEDGTKFDSSIDRGNYFECVIGTGRVIKGWDQGIMGMKVGGKRKLIVPAHLAYGERKMGKIIPANSNLIFEIELFDVKLVMNENKILPFDFYISFKYEYIRYLYFSF